MKKFLFFLVLIITINVSAQSTTWFGKPLELDNVPASTSKSDSILVRGVDKIIKWIPRSEFSGQGLKSILDTDPTADYGNSSVIFMGDYGSSKFNRYTVGDDFSSTTLFQMTNSLSLYSESKLIPSDGTSISLFEDVITLTRTKNDQHTIIKIAPPIADTQLNFPAKSEQGGIYTLATTDDVLPIAKSITGTTSGNGNSSYQLVQNDRLLIYEGTDELQVNIPPEGAVYPFYPIGYKIQIMRGSTGTLNLNRMPGVDMVSDYNIMGLKPYHSVILTKIGTNRWHVESLETQRIILPYEQNTTLTLNEYLSNYHHIFQSNTGSNINLPLNNVIDKGSTYKYTQEGDGALTLMTNGNTIVTTLPLVTTKGETRTLTKLGDNKWLMEGTVRLPTTVTNTTTVALTTSVLNTTYPTAKKGDKVYALTISNGGLIYEKTSQGWISTEILSVP